MRVLDTAGSPTRVTDPPTDPPPRVALLDRGLVSMDAAVTNPTAVILVVASAVGSRPPLPAAVRSPAWGAETAAETAELGVEVA
eukprot:6330705-Pyramimonas_sp.AAC.1